MPEDKRNQLIMQAILDKLGSNTGIYTAEDVLMAANTKYKDLQEVLKQLQSNIAEMIREEEEK